MLMALGFVPDMDGATAAEFDRAANENVFAFWWWAGSAGVVWLGASPWWATVPAVVAIHAAFAWFSCKRQAQRLQYETQRSPNMRHETSGDSAASHDRLAA
jgi:hypothetical protein